LSSVKTTCLTKDLFKKLVSLKYLNLSGCHLDLALIKELGNLEKLDLSGTKKSKPIEPGAFYGLSKLTHLDLSENDLKYNLK
jgi:hypothetical protein